MSNQKVKLITATNLFIYLLGINSMAQRFLSVPSFVYGLISIWSTILPKLVIWQSK